MGRFVCTDFVLCNKRGQAAPFDTLPRKRGPLLKGLRPPLFRNCYVNPWGFSVDTHQ